MTVAELMKELMKAPGDKEVVLCVDDIFYPAQQTFGGLIPGDFYIEGWKEEEAEDEEWPGMEREERI